MEAADHNTSSGPNSPTNSAAVSSAPVRSSARSFREGMPGENRARWVSVEAKRTLLPRPACGERGCLHELRKTWVRGESPPPPKFATPNFYLSPQAGRGEHSTKKSGVLLTSTPDRT